MWLKTNLTAKVEGFHKRVWFHDGAVTNILSLQRNIVSHIIRQKSVHLTSTTTMERIAARRFEFNERKQMALTTRIFPTKQECPFTSLIGMQEWIAIPKMIWSQCKQSQLGNRSSSAMAAATKRTILRSQETGKWLQTLPSYVNGTRLSDIKFRDALHLRYCRTPPNLPVIAMVSELNSPWLMALSASKED